MYINAVANSVTLLQGVQEKLQRITLNRKLLHTRWKREREFHCSIFNEVF
jgi:hypothetical protein